VFSSLTIFNTSLIFSLATPLLLAEAEKKDNVKRVIDLASRGLIAVKALTGLGRNPIANRALAIPGIISSSK
jgi:hypothetical protein